MALRRVLPRATVVTALAVFSAASTGAQERFSFFQASSPESVERLLTLAELRDDDVVLDLGSGDGLIPLTAARMNPRVRGWGVIETPIFGKVGDVTDDPYPRARRLNAVFAASLEQPVPASVLGDQIRDIVADESWQLRYPGGPAAAGILGRRASLTDEQYIAIGALDDDKWCDYLATNMGLNVRAHLKA